MPKKRVKKDKKKSSSVNIKVDNLDKLVREHKRRDRQKNPCVRGGAVYGLGLIGSAIYYISTATGFWNGVLGILKAIVWPVFVIYELLRFLGV